MGTVVMKLKIMPESPEADLESIKQEIKNKVVKFNEDGAKIHEIKEEPVAFGLKSIIVTIIWPESKSPDLIENSLKEIEHINSVEIIDARRLL
jgi:elongation factor 1-beta